MYFAIDDTVKNIPQRTRMYIAFSLTFRLGRVITLRGGGVEVHDRLHALGLLRQERPTEVPSVERVLRGLIIIGGGRRRRRRRGS